MKTKINYYIKIINNKLIIPQNKILHNNNYKNLQINQILKKYKMNYNNNNCYYNNSKNKKRKKAKSLNGKHTKEC